MTSVKKMKDTEKAALQNELKYYSGLLAAHYSSQRPNVPNCTTKNPPVSARSTFKTTANNVHHYKSTSFQPRIATHLTNQNSKVPTHTNFHNKIDFPNKMKVHNSFSLRKYPCKSDMVKVNPSALSYKSLDHAKRSVVYNNLLKKNLPDSKKEIVPGVVNKPHGSNSQTLMNELGVLIKQLKQRSEHIDSKINHVSSKVQSVDKCVPDKSELKVTVQAPTNSNIFSNTLNNISQTNDLGDKDLNISSSIGSLPPSSKNTNFSLNKKKDISKEKPSDDMKGLLVRPSRKLQTNLLQQKSHDVKIDNKPCNGISHKFENAVVLQVNTTNKAPIKKKPIKKQHNSVKKLSGTTLFASKYKVVNEKSPFDKEGNKVALSSPEVKTPLKVKPPFKKHITSVKKLKGARLITTKYKIINKKLPRDQSNSFQSTSGNNFSKLSINEKRESIKSNRKKMKVKLNSKYKLVNKNEKLVTVPSSLFTKKNVNKSKPATFVHQENKNLNKFITSNFSRKNLYTISKLHSERKNYKSMALLKQNHLSVLNMKRKTLFQNSFMLNSKYRTVNKQPNSCLKKSPKFAKSSDQNSSIDLDLLMELAAEKKKSNDNLVTNSPTKHILIKRVYKSKNAIVNKNICSLQTKAAKMIKTKYSILNKKHSWQKQNFAKIFSPKSFKGHKFNKYQRKMSVFYTQRNKRNNSKHGVSSYFVGRNYPQHYLPRSKCNTVGSFRSMVKTPKRFVLNRKVYVKTPNTIKSNSPVSKTMASRALNRSINRVLNASFKKKTSKVNTYCMFYNRFGRCNKGIKCPYVHDPSKIAVCTRFLRGTCKAENCPFSHEICPGKMAICSFFLLGSCTKTDCPYRHETLSPNAKLCKAFVEGYCPDGKQCKQAHVLICPQFVQGHCEKGKACPFPHPPPKGKKAISNSTEKKENLEETRELTLENVSRYFECGNESHNNDDSSVNNIAVPRIRNLGEQPSFIAL